MKRIQPKNKTAKRSKPRPITVTKKVLKKRSREKWEVHQFKKKARFCDYHHLTSKKKGGKTVLENMFRLNAYKHDAWHLLFKHLTLREIIELLERVEQIKLAHAKFQTP
ncbi:MAG: hypothetical protein WCN88_04905 [Candidatus Falkowbacteria bacterium]